MAGVPNNMSYTIKERNKAIVLIATGKADFTNANFYADLETFNWISVSRSNGVINKVSLTARGKDLSRRLLKDV